MNNDMIKRLQNQINRCNDVVGKEEINLDENENKDFNVSQMNRKQYGT